MYISDLLKSYMNENKATLAIMSEKTGLSVSYLCELKNAIKVPTSHRVKGIVSDLCGISYEELDFMCEVDKVDNKIKKLSKKWHDLEALGIMKGFNI